MGAIGGVAARCGVTLATLLVRCCLLFAAVDTAEAHGRGRGSRIMGWQRQWTSFPSAVLVESSSPWQVRDNQSVNGNKVPETLGHRNPRKHKGSRVVFLPPLARPTRWLNSVQGKHNKPRHKGSITHHHHRRRSMTDMWKLELRSASLPATRRGKQLLQLTHVAP